MSTLLKKGSLKNIRMKKMIEYKIDILQEIYCLEKEIGRKWQNKDCIIGAKEFSKLLTNRIKESDLTNGPKQF